VDDIAEGSHVWPSLTTVHQALRDAGALAVADLDRMIRITRQPGRVVEQPPVPSDLLSPELIVRASSRPVLGLERST
jgi:DNA-binding LacI/PurR family transcriptional regulator